MSSKVHGIQLSKELQKELCDDNRIEYNPNREYEFSYSIGGIILSEYTTSGKKTNEVLIPYAQDAIDAGDKFLESTVQEMKRSNRQTKLMLAVIAVLSIATIGTLMMLLRLL